MLHIPFMLVLLTPCLVAPYTCMNTFVQEFAVYSSVLKTPFITFYNYAFSEVQEIILAV